MITGNRELHFSVLLPEGQGVLVRLGTPPGLEPYNKVRMGGASVEKNSQLGLSFHCLQNIVAEMALNHGERDILPSESPHPLPNPLPLPSPHSPHV